MTSDTSKPWTQERFFAWAETQDAGYEFDGWHAIAMPIGTLVQSAAAGNLQAALANRLRGT